MRHQVAAAVFRLAPHCSRLQTHAFDLAGPAAAEFQIPRVARERGLSESTICDLVQKHTSLRDLGLLGEPRVNVLELNLALDDLSMKH